MFCFKKINNCFWWNISNNFSFGNLTWTKAGPGLATLPSKILRKGLSISASKNIYIKIGGFSIQKISKEKSKTFFWITFGLIFELIGVFVLFEVSINKTISKNILLNCLFISISKLYQRCQFSKINIWKQAYLFSFFCNDHLFHKREIKRI